ncbi:MAG: 16S rRNA (cytosine(1402)-N(4))-methyltransferase RsmH [Ignavibacteria bacterium]|nr:16S rRNA (cytosine(1402)-N(4))-methyltransferase RsmH [Ignavibacteria bacterium]
MREEVLSLLITAAGGVYVDATLGGGGHAESILQRLDPTGKLVGIDADLDAIHVATEKLSRYRDRFVTVHDNFRNLSSALSQRGFNQASGILFDLGVSSYQLDERSKGFSFRSDDRLDMRMDRTQALDAHEVVNRYTERKLADLFWRYGEEKKSRAVARAIVHRRSASPIDTTGELAAIVRGVVGDRFPVKSLARVFQAIRIEVNDELESLRRGLEQAITVLTSGGRLVVISYHSLEDRIVKEAFRNAAASVKRSGSRLLPDAQVQPRIKLLMKKPMQTSEEEVQENPRARGAKLRAAEKL